MRSAPFACIAVAVAALSCAAAQAQTLYKLIDKNGKVTYSESPPKEFDGQVVPLTIDPNANSATLPKYTPGATAAPGTMSPQEAAALQRANQRLFEARKALDEAKASPEMQRMGKVGGGAREVETQEYQDKVSKLQQDLKDAEDEVRRALPKR